MAYKITVPATVEPISIAEARQHLRIVPFGEPLAHPDDAYVGTCIKVAREFCEQYTQRALAAQTIQMAIDDFPAQSISAPFTPVNSITSITYIDGNDTEQTLPATVYALDDYSEPNWIVLKANQSWPSTNQGANNVKVTMPIGYAPSNVPSPIKAAMLLIIGNLYENRQQNVVNMNVNELPMGIYHLLQPYRLGIGI